jgi:hypothetical protein
MRLRCRYACLSVTALLLDGTRSEVRASCEAVVNTKLSAARRIVQRTEEQIA